MNAIKSGTRSKQILQLLFRNGPLTISGIEGLISPKMSKRRIQDAIQRLKKRNLVMSRDDSLPQNAAHHFQIGQSLGARTKAAEILGVNPDELLQHQFRSQELAHSEFCALWASKLQTLFPKASIIREHEFPTHPVAQKALEGMQQDRDLRPDLLFLAPKKTGSGYIKIAVEVERSPKKHERLKQKLKNFASLSLFDGVFYACSQEYIVETLRKIYLTSVLPRSRRIEHYGNFFLMFSGIEQWKASTEPKTFSSTLKNISISKWITLLSEVEMLDRRSAVFEAQL